MSYYPFMQDVNAEYFPRIMLYKSKVFRTWEYRDVYRVKESNYGFVELPSGSIDVDNEGFDAVVLRGYNHEAGNPYKMYVGIRIDGEEYLVDCLCDLFDSVGKGEWVYGSFSFIREGTLYRLVSEKSLLYKEVRRLHDASKFYTRSSLVPGHLYRGFDERAPWMLYVGEFDRDRRKLNARADASRLVFLGFMEDPEITYESYRNSGWRGMSVLIREDVTVDVDMTELNGWGAVDVSEFRDSVLDGTVSMYELLNWPCVYK